MPVCRKCGADLVIRESNPGKGGQRFNYVVCPNCKKDLKPAPAKEKEDKRKGAHLPVKKEETPKTPHWLDDYV